MGLNPSSARQCKRGERVISDKSDSRTQRGIARQSHRESLSLIESRASQREKERSPVLDPGHLIYTELDVPRGAKRRAGDTDRPNESEFESLTHIQQSTFTFWLIKPTSEARNTGAATPATHTVYPPR